MIDLATVDYSRLDRPELLMIRGADHNDLLYRGMEEYLQAIKELIEEVAEV